MNKYICITNKGEIDPLAFKLIGASSKRADNSKIGYFGSGLKYGMAVLLRNKVPFYIYSGTEEIKVSIDNVNFRGNNHENILINGTPTGFTTGMGPDWKLWFAIREIYCNALDEDLGGMAIVEEITPIANETHFYIQANEELFTMINNIDKYFSKTRTDLLWEKDDNYIYPRADDKMIIYRKGIRVLDEKVNSMFDYDCDTSEINESRTIKSLHTEGYNISAIIMQCESPQVIKRFLFEMWKQEDCWEREIYFNYSTSFCQKWREVIGDTPIVPYETSGFYQDDYNLQECVVLPKKWILKLKSTFNDLHIAGSSFDTDIGIAEKPITKYEAAMLKTVIEWYAETKMDEVLDPAEFEIKVGVFDNKKILGVAIPFKRKGVAFDEDSTDNIALNEGRRPIIVLSKQCFDLGKLEVASTLFEEMAHHSFAIKDETRAMQTKLINLLMVYAQKMNCYPL